MSGENVRASTEVAALLHAFGRLRAGRASWWAVPELAARAAMVAQALALATGYPIGTVIEALGRTVDEVVRVGSRKIDPIPVLRLELRRAVSRIYN